MPINSNKILNKIVQYGDHLVGGTSRRLRGDLGALQRHRTTGAEGIPQSTIDHVSGLSDAANASTLKTRVNTAIGLAGFGAGGFLGIHKYHQHKDNKIMERIDKMYQTDYN